MKAIMADFDVTNKLEGIDAKLETIVEMVSGLRVEQGRLQERLDNYRDYNDQRLGVLSGRVDDLETGHHTLRTRVWQWSAFFAALVLFITLTFQLLPHIKMRGDKKAVPPYMLDKRQNKAPDRRGTIPTD